MAANLTRCLAGVRFLPKLPGDAERIDLYFMPPGDFISGLMELFMMNTAKRDRKFIAHLYAERARLCEPQVMRVAGVAATNNARL